MLRVFASLGVVKTVADVNRKIIMTLKHQTTKWKNVLLSTVRMSLERRSKASSDSSTCAFPRRKVKTWAKLHLRMGQLEVVVQVEAGINVAVSQVVSLPPLGLSLIHI